MIRPRKKLYRTRAHSNVLNANDFWFPAHPGDVPISEYYPRGTGTRMPSFIDIGCGYGSLLLDLSAHFENTHVLGIEIRPKPVEYIQRKVLAIRCEAPIDLSESRHIGGGRDNGRANTEAGAWKRNEADNGIFGACRPRPAYENVWAVHNNAMRFMPNFFARGQLKKLFFCFADPHFKRKNCIATPE